ncbi:hypothetical protein GQ607_002618 [Colletotrichum asianum]|uniref:Uncharacterized protein n=1 Tax=Colletotrichum asianum TaxID=702518 RepID=A0A8H3WT72_9PEZI|nr:hypothetical protein GQ607_002618 [Colletotrichum asianum]
MMVFRTTERPCRRLLLLLQLMNGRTNTLVSPCELSPTAALAGYPMDEVARPEDVDHHENLMLALGTLFTTWF